MSFRTARNIELSILDYLTTQIEANWSSISIVKSFIKAYKEPLPVICARLFSFPPDRLEIGGNELLYDYNIIIDIFANSEGQKLDLADFIVDKLKDGCTFYEFSQTSGAPETLTKVADGLLHVKDFISNMSLDFGEDSDKYDQHRHFLSFNIRKN
mgnify:CR=1 FL=1